MRPGDQLRPAVVVVGASRGIGKAIAEVAARDGAPVVLVARSEVALAAAADDIRNAGGEAFTVPLDFLADDAALGLEDFLSANGLFCDVLVNSAGYAGPEGFVKGQYRKFNIKSTDITPGDDFGMMREVMTRRFSRLLKEEGKPDRSAEPGEDAGFPAWPDVILIDGGQGQMTAVRTILKELGIEDCVTAIGVAKGVDRDAGRERFFAEGRESFTLPPRDPVLYFIQRLRDEAHRFAIGSHRARRKKEMVKNPLDEIAGIGPTRKRALLTHFGTAKAVSRAGINDLMSVNGISETVARIVYEHFHEDAAK